MIRGIPPRTMSDVSKVRGPCPAGRRGASGTTRASASTAKPVGDTSRIIAANGPRQWRYQTRPSFKRVRGPLVDVFNEAEEVLIVVDLGGFTRGEISLSKNPEHYVLQATRGDQQFREIIDLPANVDIERSQQRLLNGVLEIVLPRRTEARPPTPTRRRTMKKEVS